MQIDRKTVNVSDKRARHFDKFGYLTHVECYLCLALLPISFFRKSNRTGRKVNLEGRCTACENYLTRCRMAATRKGKSVSKAHKIAAAVIRKWTEKGGDDPRKPERDLSVRDGKIQCCHCRRWVDEKKEASQNALKRKKGKICVQCHLFVRRVGKRTTRAGMPSSHGHGIAKEELYRWRESGCRGLHPDMVDRKYAKNTFDPIKRNPPFFATLRPINGNRR